MLTVVGEKCPVEANLCGIILLSPPDLAVTGALFQTFNMEVPPGSDGVTHCQVSLQADDAQQPRAAEEERVDDGAFVRAVVHCKDI